MLSVKVEPTTLYDEENNEFINVRGQVLTLEHSLVAISKWESKYHKPYFNKKDKTKAEWLEYFKCMTITQNVDPMIYMAFDNNIFNEISKYMNDPMTATVINSRKPRANSGTFTTSEVIYSLMVQLNIPFECQKWHINRLLTLIQVCEEAQTPKKKMSNKQVLNQYAALNAARRAKYHSKG